MAGEKEVTEFEYVLGKCFMKTWEHGDKGEREVTGSHVIGALKRVMKGKNVVVKIKKDIRNMHQRQGQ